MASGVRSAGHLTKTDWVAEELRRRILRGDVPPGASLQQGDIAESLGVSSTPVREAFAILETEGLLQKRAHRGVVVAGRDSTDLSDIYEMRMLLEPQAFRRAMSTDLEELISALDETVVEAERELAKGDIHACRRANARFHEVIVEACGPGIYGEVMTSLIARSTYAIPVNQMLLARTVTHHRGIVEALQRRDRTAAARLLHAHVREMNAMLRAGLRNATTPLAATSE